MKLCRYDDDKIGLVRGGNVHDVTAILNDLGPLTYPVAFGDPLIAALDRLRPHMEKLADAARPLPIGNARFLSPVAMPSKVIGVPVNYRDHEAEVKVDAEIAVYTAGISKSIVEQGLFLKASSSLVGPSEGVKVCFPERRTDHEAELGIVIGRKTGPVSEADALGVIAGYAIALDMVVRGPEDRSYRKSPDTYAVLGPWMVTADEFGEPEGVGFWLKVNGEPRQKANTTDMIIGVRRQIAWASSLYTLYPGDIIMSGTPAGVGPVKAGDTMTMNFDRIGDMTVPVR